MLRGDAFFLSISPGGGLDYLEDGSGDPITILSIHAVLIRHGINDVSFC